MKRLLTLIWAAGWCFAVAQEATSVQPVAIGIGPAGENPQSAPPDVEWRVADMELDGDGVIWAIAMPLQIGEGNADGRDQITKLAVFDLKTCSWQAHPCDIAGDGVALLLQKLADGSVACLWRSGERTFLTKHRNSRSSAWVMLNTVFNQPRLCAGAAGGLIITETGPKVARITDGDKPPLFFTIPDIRLTAPEKPEEHRSYAPIHAIQAGDGTFWLWSYSLRPQKHLWRIHGFLCLSEGRLDGMEGLPFDSASTFSAVLADGSDHLYISEAGSSLWHLPIQGGNADRIDVPGREFEYIEHLSFVGPDLHIVTCPRPDEIDITPSTTVKNQLEMQTTSYYDKSKPTGEVYRIRSGLIEMLADGLDDRPGFGRLPRHIAHTPAGLMIGSPEGGPTWIETAPKAVPRRLGREAGFDLRDAIEMLPLSGDRWLARATDTTWAVLSTTAREPSAPERVTTIKTTMPVVQDPENHIWAWRLGDEGFARWSNGRWDRQSTPPVSCEESLDMVVDQHGQAWLLNRKGGKSAVLDFASGKWTAFDTPEQAIEKKLIPGDTLRIRRFLVLGPVSHENGSKGFLDWDGTVHVFQGGKWRRSLLSEIAGPKSAASGIPFFDVEGRFNIPVEHRHYQIRSDGQWEHVQGANTDRDRTHEREEESPPADSKLLRVTSTAYDRHGIAWMTQRGGRVWKELDGTAVEVKGPDGKALLPPNASIREVLADDQGTVFLKQSDGYGQIVYHCLKGRTQKLPTKVSVEINPEGVPRVVFPKVPQGWHRLRIDKGGWTPPTQDQEAVLQALSPGRHHLEIQTFDAELNPLAEIASLEIKRDPAGIDAIRESIARLDADALDEREKGAAELRVQGALALPELRQSLEVAEPDSALRWWLTAVIQSIEESEK
jgi:hypothetical protein